MIEENKNAIDVIYDMYDILLKMQNKLDALEKHNALLTNLLTRHVTTNTDTPKGRTVNIEPVIADVIAPLAQIQPAVVSSIANGPMIVPAGPENKAQSTKVFGILKDAEGKILHGIPVSIVDAKTNTVVKATKTNRAGEFMSFLPLGKYIAVATFENNQQKFKPFDLNQGMRDIEVSII